MKRPTRPDKVCHRPRCKASFTCVDCGTHRCSHLIVAGRTDTLTGVCQPCARENNTLIPKGVR